jgi:hypothetical protein
MAESIGGATHVGDGPTILCQSKTSARSHYKQGATRMTEKDYKRLTEIVADSVAHPSRLTAWENNFIAGIQSGIAIHGNAIRISDKQWEVLTRIERKVYAT